MTLKLLKTQLISIEKNLGFHSCLNESASQKKTLLIIANFL